MNHIYKLVRHRVSGAWTVVSEITRAGGPGGAVSRACAAAAMLIAPCGAGAQSITDTGDPGEISAPASMSPSTWDYGSAPLQAGINQNKSGKLEVRTARSSRAMARASGLTRGLRPGAAFRPEHRMAHGRGRAGAGRVRERDAGRFRRRSRAERRRLARGAFGRLRHLPVVWPGYRVAGGLRRGGAGRPRRRRPGAGEGAKATTAPRCLADSWARWAWRASTTRVPNGRRDRS